LNSEKIWKIWKKGKLNSEMIRKIWNISVLVIITPKETPCSSLSSSTTGKYDTAEKEKNINLTMIGCLT
jgi:hypothetical protein